MLTKYLILFILVSFILPSLKDSTDKFPKCIAFLAIRIFLFSFSSLSTPYWIMRFIAEKFIPHCIQNCQFVID